MDYKFRFKRERVENTFFLRPKVKVTLSYKNLSQTVIAVIDTGSDLNYLPADIAEYFGIPLSEREFTAQGAEQEFSYRTSNIYVKLDNPHMAYRKLVPVMVPVKVAMHKDIILGSAFLKDFVVTLDYP